VISDDEICDEEPWKRVEDIYEEAAREEIERFKAQLAGGARIKLRHLLHRLDQQPTNVFWPVFLAIYPGSAYTWPHRRWALELLRQHTAQEPARNYMRRAPAELFDWLPPVVTAFRGCSQNQVRGLSWTTSKEVAWAYADADLGKQKNRVLATARIPKSSIFALWFNSKSEIIVDPDRLLNVSSANFNFAIKGRLLSIPPLNGKKI
jgi:hypothetical protein